VLVPDQIVSDGSLAAVQRYAVDGYQVVLAAWLRFGEEPLFKHLKQMGVAPLDSGVGDMARPLVATGRQLVSAGIRSFHSETLSYEWEAPYFVDVPSAVWWRVPGEDGVIVHSLSWAPLLIDYDAVEHHDSSVMDNWTIDGDYIHRNFGLNGKVHVVQDSDELMLVSWAPLADRPSPLTPRPEYTRRFLGELKKGIIFNRVLSSPFFDPLKRQILYKPVYWHSETINLRDKGPWLFTEARAQRVLRMYGTGGLNLNMYGAAGGLMLKLTHLRNALRIFRDAVGTKYVLHDADGINHSWVNISLTQKIPAYNHAINLWIQATGNSWAKEDICGFVLKHMAEGLPSYDAHVGLCIAAINRDGEIYSHQLFFIRSQLETSEAYFIYY
jgi:hypothetical protein